jgi:hypothetical protein
MQFQDLERLLSGGVLLVGLALLGLLGWVMWWLRSHRLSGPTPSRKAKALPKHQVALKDINPDWQETNYERMLEHLHGEILAAVQKRDRESLAVFAQAQAEQSFASQMGDPLDAEDRREVLQGSVRQKWDASSSRLVVVLAISRWRKGWRRFYEEWVFERQGAAWFVVERRPTKL